MFVFLGSVLLCFYILLIVLSGSGVLEVLSKGPFNLHILLDEKYLTSILLIISISVCLYNQYYIENEKEVVFFSWFLILFIVSMVIFILSSSGFWIFVGWEGLGISSFFLINNYNNWSSQNNALFTSFSNRFGDFFVLLFFSCLVWGGLNSLTPVFLVLVGITKSAQFPFCSWLPAAISAPTPISSLVHSSTLVTAGIIFISNSETEIAFSFLILLLSSLSVFLSGLSAINENDINKIVALSTLNQISVIFFLLGINLNELAIFFMLIHAFLNSLLFFSVGGIIHSNLSLQETRKSSSFWGYPVSSFLFFVSLTSISGILTLSGAVSNEAVIETLLSTSNSILSGFILLGMSFTLYYGVAMFISILNVISFSLKLESSKKMLFSSFLLFILSVFIGNFISDTFSFLFEEASIVLLVSFFASSLLLLKGAEELGNLFFINEIITLWLYILNFNVFSNAVDFVFEGINIISISWINSFIFEKSKIEFILFSLFILFVLFI